MFPRGRALGSLDRDASCVAYAVHCSCDATDYSAVRFTDNRAEAAKSAPGRKRTSSNGSSRPKAAIATSVPALTLDTHQAQDSFITTGEREAHVIGVIVSFRYGNDFNEEAVRRIAETARPKFEGMPGLRSKAFTFDAAKHEATNFYVWDSEDAARGFFTEQTIQRISGVYGIRPTVQYVQIASLVENTKTS